MCIHLYVDMDPSTQLHTHVQCMCLTVYLDFPWRQEFFNKL